MNALVMEEGLPLDEIEQRIEIAYGCSGLAHRVVAFYLADVDVRGLHQLRGCRTTAQFASLRFSMSEREGRDLLKAGKALQELKKIDAAFEKGRLCWSKVRELIKVASPDHEAKWLEKALNVPIKELILEVKLAKQGEAPRERDDRKGLPEIRLRMNTALPPDVYAKWERVRQKINDESGRTLQEWECLEAVFDLTLSLRDDGTVEGKKRVDASAYAIVLHSASETGVTTVETEDGLVPVSKETAEMIACDARAYRAEGENHTDEESNGRTNRNPSTSLRNAVLTRDGVRCRACGTRYRLHTHHVEHWEKGGLTVARNLVTLCRMCHALHHAGLLVVRGDAKSGWRFEDREGCDIHDLERPAARVLAEILGGVRRLELRKNGRATTNRRLVQLRDVPRSIDGDWWRRHRHLIRSNERGGTFELRAGTPLTGTSLTDAGLTETSVGTRANRPVRFSEIVGQKAVVASLEEVVRGALAADEAVGHTLLCGASGLGKTTIALAMANELGARLHAASGAFLKDSFALVSLVAGLRKGDVLFIDEVHALSERLAEVLYEALEDGRVSLLMASGADARTLTLQVEPFTLIGATTKKAALSDALLSRFENHEQLAFYDVDELGEIIRRLAAREGVEISREAARRLAMVSRRTPREAVRLFRRTRGAALARGRRKIDVALVRRTLEMVGIDELGLRPLDRRYLEILRRQKRPVAVARLAAMLGVDVQTLERLHEPHLFELGLATTTLQGRIVLPGAERSRVVAAQCAASGSGRDRVMERRRRLRPVS